MSPLYISDSEVRALLDMRTSIQALESVFWKQAGGQAKNSPRQRTQYWGAKLNIMSAGAQSGRFAFKAYAITRAPTVYHVMLYDIERGLLAIIEAGALGQMRTGAATAVATDRLAAKTAATLGMIGAGKQARTQLEAVAAVRDLRGIKVFARDATRLAAFCSTMSSALGRPVSPAKSAEDCVADADILVTATNSVVPVVEDRWLKRGVHINTIGANAANRMEIEPATYARARLIVTDDSDQAYLEAGDIIHVIESGQKAWSDIKTLSEIVAHDRKYESGAITIFKSLGAALEDLAVASAVYDRAIVRSS